MLAMVLGLWARPVQGQDIAIEPEQAGPEFRIQGEYAGSVGAVPIGIQVRAPGPGQFKALVMKGGFPGDGWDGSAGLEVNGTLTGGNGVFSGGGYSFTIPGPGTALSGSGPTGAVNLTKVMRGSRSMGLPAPQGAEVIFNGTGIENFRLGAQFDANRKLLYTGATTKSNFKSVRLHIEFRNCWKISGLGQLRSNSGVLFKDRWEIQILDSYGFATPSSDDCGGMYGQFPPSVNMCLPPLSWQTLDIDFKDVEVNPDFSIKNQAMVTVFHNGVLIHNKKAYTGITIAGANLIVAADGIRLQDYGSRTQNPVFYRNIWAVVNPPDLLDSTWLGLVAGPQISTRLVRGAFAIRPKLAAREAGKAWVGVDGRFRETRWNLQGGSFGAWFPAETRDADQHPSLLRRD